MSNDERTQNVSAESPIRARARDRHRADTRSARTGIDTRCPGEVGGGDTSRRGSIPIGVAVGSALVGLVIGLLGGVAVDAQPDDVVDGRDGTSTRGGIRSSRPGWPSARTAGRTRRPSFRWPRWPATRAGPPPAGESRPGRCAGTGHATATATQRRPGRSSATAQRRQGRSAAACHARARCRGAGRCSPTWRTTPRSARGRASSRRSWNHGAVRPQRRTPVATATRRARWRDLAATHCRVHPRSRVNPRRGAMIFRPRNDLLVNYIERQCIQLITRLSFFSLNSD